MTTYTSRLTVPVGVTVRQLPETFASRTPEPVKVLLRPAARAARYADFVPTRKRPPLGNRPPIEVAVCAIFRNEGRYLAEWVAFHQLQGVSRFYLYDNGSTDNWRDELRPWLAAGDLVVTPWPEQPGQRPAYIDCLKRFGETARWIAFIDTDEFLFSPTTRPLPDVLRRFDTYPGVVANWRCYGLNGWEKAPEGLVIENYLRRAADSEPNNRFVKCLVFPRLTREPSEGPHYFHFRRWAAVGEDRQPVYWSTREPITADLLRINHYFAKSAEDLSRKTSRPTAWDGVVGECGVGSWAEIPEDVVEDPVLLPFAPAVKARLAQQRNG